jgi:4-amino-4-deoxy-L-arabinose transferase-like glycosyltransferase
MWSRRLMIANALWQAMPRPVRAAALALVKRLDNPSTANRCAAVLLLSYAVLWAISATIRNLGLSIHGDMAETFALSRELALGYVKHPPLINWITAAWFAVMPVAHWSFYLLACLNAALAMWAVWLAAGYLVDRRRRILAVALLGLTPIFTFHAATFNHNTIQLSLWALVALSFLVSIERAHLGWSILFGVASGLAMLGKYFAGVIVLACFLAAFLHPNGRSYWRSPRPYVAAVACLIVLAPNLYWLVRADFISITHNVAMQPQATAIQIIARASFSAGAFVAYLAPAFLAIWLLLPGSTAAMMRTIAAGWPARRAVIACIAFAPVVLPLIAFAIAGIGMPDAWIVPAYFFAPLAIISAPGLVVTYRAVAMTVAGVAIAAVLAVVAAPMLMVTDFLIAKAMRAEPFAALARIATVSWHSRTGRPLEVVSGSPYPVWSLSFYSEDHPMDFPGYGRFPPNAFLSFRSAADIERRWSERGVLGVCRASESWCTETFARSLPGAKRLDVTLPITFLGMSRGSERYVLYIAPGRVQQAGQSR